MSSLEKGTRNFVFLWVLNPIALLFYQNCSPSNLSRAAAERAPSSVEAAKIEETAPPTQQPLRCGSSQRKECFEY